MPFINTISVLIATANVEDAGTDGSVYLGLCGREFHCDTSADDFERNRGRYYHFGKPPTPAHAVSHPTMNDPRTHQLHSSLIDKFPVYLRFEQGASDHWALDLVRVHINQITDRPPYQRDFLRSPLWLGKDAGSFCYLEKMRDVTDGLDHV